MQTAADILVDRQVVVEIKAVAKLVPAHDAQVLTYLRMSSFRVGPLFNFHAPLLRTASPIYHLIRSVPLRGPSCSPC